MSHGFKWDDQRGVVNKHGYQVLQLLYSPIKGFRVDCGKALVNQLNRRAVLTPAMRKAGGMK